MSTAVAHEHEEDHGHHHKETFVTKYIFSQDHKMISKQYLITGLFMGIIGIAMSLLFRLQLAWPEQPFGIFECPSGKMGTQRCHGSQCLFGIGNHSRYHYGLFCTHRRIEWNL